MIIVDYSQVAISALMADIKGHPGIEISTPLVRHMILNMLRGYKQKYGAEFGDLVIACDNRKYWRREKFSHYKANRKNDRDTSIFDWEGIFSALNQIKAELDTVFPYPVIEVPTAEADDVIASLVLWSQENDLVQVGLEEEPQPILILSGDKDFVQLQRYKNVKQYSPLQKKWMKLDGTADQVLMEHLIYGDTGDGIPNFLSDGATFVTPGMRQKPIRKADVAKWRNMSIADFEGHPGYTGLLRNRDLIDLREIPESVRLACINSYVQQKGARDRSQLFDYFVEHKMKNLLEHLTEF